MGVTCTPTSPNPATYSYSDPNAVLDTYTHAYSNHGTFPDSGRNVVAAR